MKDGLHQSKKPQRSLDERFAHRPHTYERLHQIADMMEQAIADGASADEAEALAVEQIRRLGGELLRDWAEARHDQAVEQARLKQPGAQKHKKKE